MRLSPLCSLFFLLLSGLAAAQMNPGPPVLIDDVRSLSAAPPGRLVSPGRALTGDFDGDLLDDYVVFDHNRSELSVMWEPGIQECLQADIATVVDFAVRPGTDRDELLVIDGGGLKLLSHDQGDWSLTTLMPSWSGIQRIETYQEAGGVLQVIGLDANGQTLRRVRWVGGLPVADLLFTVPVPVLAFEAYDRSGTTDPGIAVMIDGGLGLYDLAGNVLAYHSSTPPWTCDAITAFRHDSEDHDRIALVTTMPNGINQYLVVLDENGVLATPPLWNDRDVAELIAVDYDVDGYEDLVVTFEDDGATSLLLNMTDEETPIFQLGESTDYYCPGSPSPTAGYHGMPAATDVDADGDQDLLYATIDGHLAVIINQTEVETDWMPSLVFAKSTAAMVVDADLLTNLSFSTPSTLPPGPRAVELMVYRQTSSGDPTTGEPVLRRVGRFSDPGQIVTFEEVDLDGGLTSDGYNLGIYYYLVVRCVEEQDGELEDVCPARIIGLHVSRFWTGHAIDEADDYLEDVASSLWAPCDIDRFLEGYGDLRIGRDSIVPCLPWVWFE